MKFESRFSVHCRTNTAGQLRIPSHISYGSLKADFRPPEHISENIALYVVENIEMGRLSVVQSPKSLDDSPSERLLRVEGLDKHFQAARILVNIATFAADVPLTISSPLGGRRLICESQIDETALSTFGTQKVEEHFDTVRSLRVFVDFPTEMSNMDNVLDRQVGLHLYADAIGLTVPGPQYRELWRILESAFRLKGPRLIKRLLLFEPLKRMGLSGKEAQAHLELRNNVSHAYEVENIVKIREFEPQVATQLPRLKCLVEMVILSKKKWGMGGIEWNGPASATGYVGPDGVTTVRAGIVGEKIDFQLLYVDSGYTVPVNLAFQYPIQNVNTLER